MGIGGAGLYSRPAANLTIVGDGTPRRWPPWQARSATGSASTQEGGPGPTRGRDPRGHRVVARCPLSGALGRRPRERHPAVGRQRFDHPRCDEGKRAVVAAATTKKRTGGPRCDEEAPGRSGRPDEEAHGRPGRPDEEARRPPRPPRRRSALAAPAARRRSAPRFRPRRRRSARSSPRRRRSAPSSPRRRRSARARKRGRSNAQARAHPTRFLRSPAPSRGTIYQWCRAQSRVMPARRAAAARTRTDRSGRAWPLALTSSAH